MKGVAGVVLLLVAFAACVSLGKSSKPKARAGARSYNSEIAASMVKCNGDFKCCQRFMVSFRGDAERRYQALLTEQGIRNFLLLEEGLNDCVKKHRDGTKAFRLCIRRAGEAVVRRTRDLQRRKAIANARQATRLCSSLGKSKVKVAATVRSRQKDSRRSSRDGKRSGGSGKNSASGAKYLSKKYKTCSYGIKHELAYQMRRVRSRMHAELHRVHRMRRQADFRPELAFLALAREAMACNNATCYRAVLARCPQTPTPANRRCRFFIAQMPLYDPQAGDANHRIVIRRRLNACARNANPPTCRRGVIRDYRADVESRLRAAFFLARALAMRAAHTDMARCNKRKSCEKKVFSRVAEQQVTDSTIILQLTARAMSRACKKMKKPKDRSKCSKGVKKQLAYALRSLRRRLLSRRAILEFIRRGARSALFGNNNTTTTVARVSGKTSRKDRRNRKSRKPAVDDDDEIEFGFRDPAPTARKTTKARPSSTSSPAIVAIVQEQLRGHDEAVQQFISDDTREHSCASFDADVKRLDAHLSRLIRRSRRCGDDSVCLESTTARINAVHDRIVRLTDRCSF